MTYTFTISQVLKVETAKFGVTELRKLLARVFEGKPDVLQYAFSDANLSNTNGSPNSSGRPDDDSSSVSSVNSYDVLE